VKLFKRLLVFLLAISLILAAYFLFTNYVFTDRLHTADVVPADAIFVFETEEPVNTWNQLVNQPLWGRLRDIPSLKDLENQLLALDSLAGRSGKLESSLKGNLFSVSLHQSGREEFDFLFSIAFSGKDHEDFIQSLVEKITPTNVHSRNYSGVKIFEYTSPQSNTLLSFAVINNLVLGSYSSFLLEDAIRHAQSDQLKGFKAVFPALFKNQAKPTGLGLLRVSSTGIAKFIQGISRGGDLKGVEYFSKNSQSSNLELKFTDNKVVFEGTSFFDDGETVEISWNTEGTPEAFNNYVSNRAAVFHRYNVKDPIQIQAIPNPAFEARGTLQGDMDNLFPETVFFNRLTGEIGYMILEESGGSGKDRLLLLKTDKVKEQVDLLKEFSLNLVGEDPEKVGRDYYLGKEIFRLSAEEFPAHLFEGQFAGFQNTFITDYNDMIVLGNSIKAMRTFLDDVYNDNTWGKSIHHKRFLEELPKQSGYEFITNISRLWNDLIGMASPEWKVFFQKYAPQLKSVDWVVLDQKDESTNIQFSYRLDSINSVTSIVLAEDMAVQFNELLIYGPRSIQNFNDRSTDYLVQDERSNIHLLTADGEIVFSQQVEGEIVGDIFQVDYYKNGKLQILFATQQAVYGYDRSGTLLPGYPIKLPSGEAIDFLNLVDYNKDRDYRYFVASESGTLYLFDKNGNALEGWSPKYTSGKLASAPAHYRIAGRGDFMIAFNSTGELYLMNRKGELPSVNPVKLGEGLSTEYALVENNQASESQLVTINQEGEVVKVNFNGEITYRNQLLRPDRFTKYHLVKDQSQRNHLFVLHEYNKISVLNSDAEPLFEKGMFSDEVDFQYFYFGGDKSIFVVIDKVQEFIYLYNLQGELLNTRPISGSQRVEINYSGSNNEYGIFAIDGHRFSEYKMPL